MPSLILFLKGFIIGIGKIIPGVSGSLLAISLGVYQKSLDCLNSFFKRKRQSFQYLIPLGMGVLLAVLIGSRILLYFFTNHYVYTVMFFIGLIVGTIPSILRQQSFELKDWCIIGMIIFLLFFCQNYFVLQNFSPDGSLKSNLFIIFLGFVDALTTVLPGVSGTATFMMLGSYEFILLLFSSPFSHIFSCFFFGFGLFIGLFFMVKLVSFCFRKYEHMTWVIIMGFLLSSVSSLFLNLIECFSSTNLFPSFLLFFIGFQVVSFLDIK